MIVVVVIIILTTISLCSIELYTHFLSLSPYFTLFTFNPLVQGCNEYEKRLKPVLNLQTIYCKSDSALIDAIKQSKGNTLCLDENGKTFTSRQFTTAFYKTIEDSNKATVNFVIGGYAGLPMELKQNTNNNKLISLSNMTWTHSMARLLLLEQVYRATEIHKGSGYHKD